MERVRPALGWLASELARAWARSVRGFLVATPWCYSRAGCAGDAAQGWKLHLSATPLSAGEVLRRVRPILRRRGVLYKVPASLQFLEALNLGKDGFAQIGKFLTVYPRSVTEASELLRTLHLATRGLSGPIVPYDVRYGKGSVVFYRFGSFTDPHWLRDGKGRRRVDRRQPGCAVPRWLADPFQKRRRSRSRPRGPFGRELLPLKLISQRGKGNVYAALDLTVYPMRKVIVKEGRRHGETAIDGQDGLARVRHEAAVLRSLRRAGVPVPAIVRQFRQDDVYYLVLEMLPGRPLLSPRRPQPVHPSWARSARILRRLAPILAAIHAAGWVWRDGKPSHILLQRGAISVIDFEGACPLAQTEALPWGSPDYVVAPQPTFSRRPGWAEDDFALGVVAFQFGSGHFPSRKKRERAAVYRATNCGEALRAQIETLLEMA